MTTLRAALATGTVLGLLGATAAPAQDVAYTLVNDTALTVMEFYTSPANEEMWGDDILGSAVIAPGETGTVTIADGSDQCAYDLRFVFDDGSEYTDSQDICAMDTYTLQQN